MKDVPVRCTMPDGKVTNERGSCPPGAKIEITRSDSDRPNGGQPGSQWYYEKVVDSMTGKARCTASSPKGDLMGRTYRDSATVRAVVTVALSKPTVRFELGSGGALFHPNVADAGLRVGQSDFIPFAGKPTQTSMQVQAGADAAIVDSMLNAQDFKIRARLWPWDNLVDSTAISMAGFKQAYTLALACSM